ncbi:putative uncharacterized protein [Parachlamydia acanthamoebae UV-7]|uniref:6-hydroxymethylpterin diphosphokinase MptE-like domain-containing protein n=2 Tax=Parachlamydia acanthamoebae TaxID=83552 RepID=F8L099_PARAV|nr:6-hydroxymethylpterin diphosphokinase MptE-like protein [Parachlamydia acanthamoebae]EFB41597.1 hypothetical protein pah_c026o019 [Parachlamydia acanthamoebae str. Hall's coccus]CCB86629.1 putative uncharacterized protein [Parachlamydia acanthamoebae UV-7]
MQLTLFEKNLALFADTHPEEALRLKDLSLAEIELRPTWAGESNLYNQENHFFYHSKQNAKWEAKKWFESLNLEGVQALFVIGVGLGYYYLPLMDWLKRDPARFVIFIEDDLRVFGRLLETEIGTAILTHPQVVLKYFETPTERGWGAFRSRFNWVFEAFASATVTISGLKEYAENRRAFCLEVSNQILMNLAEKKEFLDYFRLETQKQVFTNFYYNAPYVSEVGWAHALYGQFKNVPAIICGAGPSLSKHFERLKQMHDQAIIFGAGSALNALTTNGITAHFGAGVDPTEIQENRMRTNHAFGVPFFYRMRFNAGAFQELPGPALYVASGSDYYSTDWFERQWGIHSPKQIEAGTSTTHFCLKIAEALGCNPIILVGMDLAYTQGKQYAEGVLVHPSSGNKEREQISRLKQEQWVKVKGIKESEVNTTWNWIQEAALYTEFLLENPKIQLINATEGGMSIWQIPNESFADVYSKRLTNQLNLEGRIQTLVQNSLKQPIDIDKVLTSLKIWSEYLRQAINCCQDILSILNAMRDAVLFQKSSWDELHTQFDACLFQLKNELVYKEFFHKVDEIFTKLSLREEYLNQKRADTENKKGKKLKSVQLRIKRYTFLLDHLQIHLEGCLKGIESFLDNQRILQKKEPHSYTSQLHDHSHYEVKEGILRLEDPELNLFIHEIFEAKEVAFSKETWKDVSYYQGALLHGPSRIYDSSRILFSETWYVHGVKQGKAKDYDLSGQLCRQRGYKNGLLHGLQLEFYLPGILKSQLMYVEGKLEGEALFFHKNGRLRRRSEFQNGKADGIEQYWDAAGKLIIESTYRQGISTGMSQRWYSNGQLARLVVYGDQGEPVEIKEWDEKGYVKT